VYTTDSIQRLGLYLDGHLIDKREVLPTNPKDFIFYLGSMSEGTHCIGIVNDTDPDSNSPRFGILFDYIKFVPSSDRIITIPADYTSITEGIENAIPGDTIYIKNGEYLEEKIPLKSGITLIGETPHETIINGGNETVLFGAYKSKVENITIKTEGKFAIDCKYDFMSVSHTIITSGNTGIYGQSLSLIGNTIVSNDCCIHIGQSDSNSPIPSLFCRNNILYSSIIGIYLDSSDKYRIDLNQIDNVVQEMTYNSFSSQYTIDPPYIEYICEKAYGNIKANPCFEDPNQGDYHLKSYSPCIDAGDPNSDYSMEPEDNGQRINIGAYGNTPWATKSLDSDDDGVRDYIELAEDTEDNDSQYWLDNKNALFRTSIGDKRIKISLDSNENTSFFLNNVRIIDIYELPITDLNIPTTHFLYGLWSFSVKGVNPQDSVVVDIHFPDTLFDVLEYIVYDQDEGWKILPIKIDYSRSIVSIELIKKMTREREEEDGEIIHIGGITVPYPFHADLHSYSCFISGLLR
jgi:hypothetical protein